MRKRGWFTALIACGLALYSCGVSDFHTGKPSSSSGGAPGGMGGEGTGGAASGGDGLGGAATGGIGIGTSGAGGAGTGGVATGGTGGGTGEPPIPTSGLVLWLRADAGLTVSGGRVSVWKDQSQSGISALQTVSSLRPTFVEAGLNGKPTVQFDGVDDFLSLPDGVASFAEGLSIFIVLEEHAAGVCGGYLELTNGSEGDDIHVGYWNDHLLYEVKDDWVHGDTVPLVFDEPQLVTVIHGVDDGVQLRRDADELPSNSTDFSVPLPAPGVREDNFIGKTLYDSCVFFDGSISEILMYDRGVSDEELITIEGYLQERWLTP